MQKHKLIIYQMTNAKVNIALDVAVDKIKKVDNFEMIIDEHNIEDKDVILCKRRLVGNEQKCCRSKV